MTTDKTTMGLHADICNGTSQKWPADPVWVNESPLLLRVYRAAGPRVNL